MSTLQSVVFPRDKWSLKDAKAWISDHDYKLSFFGKGVDIKPTQYRFRQYAPNFTNYRTKKLDNGVLLVCGLR